ncbi:hypothetical protein D3C72_1836390 [compost metagenome]
MDDGYCHRKEEHGRHGRKHRITRGGSCVPLHQPLRNGVGHGKQDQRTPQSNLPPKKAHGPYPVGNRGGQREGMVDDAHHAPGGSAFNQLQDIGQRQQEIADGKNIHPHPVARQATANK